MPKDWRPTVEKSKPIGGVTPLRESSVPAPKRTAAPKPKSKPKSKAMPKSFRPTVASPGKSGPLTITPLREKETGRIKLPPHLQDPEESVDLRALKRIAARRERSGLDDTYWGVGVRAEAEDQADSLLDANVPTLSEMAYGLAEPEGDMVAVFSGPQDSRTCGLCASLVGMKCRVDSEEYAMYSPPLHHRCRHYWNYMRATMRGAKVNFVRPDPVLVRRHGHLIGKPNPDVQLRVPATPSDRDFIVKTDADGVKRVHFAPDPHLEAEAKATLRRLDKELATTGQIRQMTREAFEHWVAQPAVQQLEKRGLVDVAWQWGSNRTKTVFAPDKAAVEELLSTSGDWTARRVASIEPASKSLLPGGMKGKQWKVVYNERDTARVRLTQLGKQELASQRLG